MCQRCKNPICGGCQTSLGGDSAQVAAQVAAQLSAQQTTINNLINSLGAFLNGHPIMAFEHPDDIALFDLTTGWGSGYLANWAIADGSQYLSPTLNKQIKTPNCIDCTLVQSTGTYNVDDTAGSQNINLTISQLPVHTHVVTDPGHTHSVTDPGHQHAIQDGVSGAGHTHSTTAGTVTGATGVTTSNSGHAHQSIGSFTGSDASGPHSYAVPNLNSGGGSFADHQIENSHTHNVSVNPFNTNVTVNAAFTGVEVLTNTTGITNQNNTTGITNQNTGSDAAIDIRQPSYAVLYAMKIY